MHKGLLLVNCNKYTVDRFDEGLAILLLKSNENIQLKIPQEQLGSTVNEGDILEIELDEMERIIKFKILEVETKEMKEKVEELINKLKNK